MKFYPGLKIALVKTPEALKSEDLRIKLSLIRRKKAAKKVIHG